MVLPAPARFSTITCCPSPSASFAATSRVVISGIPAGAFETMIRIGRAGYGCALAAAAMASMSPARSCRIRFMCDPLPCLPAILLKAMSKTRMEPQMN
jgi:hypothetical protein